MTTFTNSNRFATIRKNAFDEFDAFVGFQDEERISPNGMQVIKLRTYKRESAAIKFCKQWVN